MPSARARTHAGTAVWAASIQAGHHGDPGDAAEYHRDAESGNESPERGQRAHEREEQWSRSATTASSWQPALHPRQERGADDRAETEAAEQKTVAEGTEAEVPARDDGQQGPERAAQTMKTPGPNQHGDERRSVARVTDARLAWRRSLARREAGHAAPARRQRYTTTSTATNDTALSAKTSAGPAAATRTPPRAGPIARPMLTGNALSVTARVSSDAWHEL